MSKLVEHIQALAHSFKSQTELDNAYLAQATDSDALERCRQEIDFRRRAVVRVRS